MDSLCLEQLSLGWPQRSPASFQNKGLAGSFFFGQPSELGKESVAVHKIFMFVKIIRKIFFFFHLLKSFYFLKKNFFFTLQYCIGFAIQKNAYSRQRMEKLHGWTYHLLFIWLYINETKMWLFIFSLSFHHKFML